MVYRRVTGDLEPPKRSTTTRNLATLRQAIYGGDGHNHGRIINDTRIMSSVPHMHDCTRCTSPSDIWKKLRYSRRFACIGQSNHIDLCKCHILQGETQSGKEKSFHD